MSLEFETRIESYDVHPNNNARISAIFKLFQKAAGDDMDSTGLTYNMLREKNIAFFTFLLKNEHSLGEIRV